MEKYQYVVLQYSPPGTPGIQPSGWFNTAEDLQDCLTEWGSIGWEFPHAIIVKEKWDVQNAPLWGYRLRDAGFNGIESAVLLGRRKLVVALRKK